MRKSSEETEIKKSQEIILRINKNTITFLLLSLVVVLLSLNLIKTNHLTSHTLVPSPTPTQTPKPNSIPTTTPASNPTNNTPSKTSQITCTGPDGKSFTTTKQKCDEFNTAWGHPPTPDPNEIVKCNISLDCGGGSKEVPRSTCNQLTCCTLRSGNILTSDKDCKTKVYAECYEASHQGGWDVSYCDKYK